MGVTNIFPIITEHSVIKKFNYKRANACAIAASQQSGRLNIPKIHEIKELKKLLDNWNNDNEIIFCDEKEKKNYFKNLFKLKLKKINTVLIGPEGGFTSSEKNFLNDLNYIHGISLGKRILRADTAAIAALSLLVNIVR